MCSKLKHYQYIIDCDRHGKRIQSKYYDDKINRVGICKLCDWEQKFIEEVKSKENNFVKFLEPIFKNTQKVKAICSIHGEYENFVSNILRAKKSAGCYQCAVKINRLNQYKRSFKNKTEKKCTKCKQIKPIKEFHTFKRKTGRECLSPKCIKCANEKSRIFSKKYEKKYGSTHKARAKYFGCYYEKVDKLKVFNRDKYTCKECGIKCNPNNHFNAKDYPTLGHIVPISLKGSHSYSNVQCECRYCNMKKSNKMTGQQLTLYYGG